MDRREALKKLAAGSAIAFASPLIVKSTAFADQGTVSCLPTPFADPNGVLADAINVVSEAGYPRIRLLEASPAFTAIGCPLPFTKFVQYRWTPISAPIAFAVINNGNGNDITDVWRRQENVRLYESAAATGLTTPGPYVVLLQFRVACRTPARSCWLCTGFQITVNWDGTAVTSSSVVATDSTPNCDNAPPPPA